MKARILAACLLSVVILAAGCSKSSEPQSRPAAQQAAQGATAPSAGINAAGVQAAGAPLQTLPDFAAIAEANKGAVVNITSTISRPRQMRQPFGGQGSDDDEDNPLNEFL